MLLRLKKKKARALTNFTKIIHISSIAWNILAKQTVKLLTLMLERRTGDSRKEEGLRPGGMVIHVDLEIGSLAGVMSLYLAPPLDPAAPELIPPSVTAEIPSLSCSEEECCC